ncbi:major facilitator superfamily domain-containing protein [Xylariales sp. PMI_506]|nr:major facilitator superfamily domain-containing protein [Xylariales sp. PMI_506]
MMDTKTSSATCEVTAGSPVAESPLPADSFEEKAPRLHAKTFLAVFAVCLIYFAQLVTVVGVGAQGQTIAGHFGGTSSVVWLTAPITILTVVLGPVVSHAADFMGRRGFLVSLTLIGAAGCVVIARAGSMNAAIAGCCLVGVAFGAQPLLHTVSSEVLPRRWRGYGQAADMASNGIGTMFGLLVGGALNRTNNPSGEGFRTYFLINMACYAAAAILTILVYNPPLREKQKQFTFTQKLAHLDWVGYFLLASGLVLFSVGLSWSQNPYQWSDPRVSATFAIGLVLFLGLIGYETWIKKDGMFHHGLFTGNRNFAIAAATVFAEGVAFFAANTYFAFQISVLYETDALIVGVRYSIMPICATISSGLIGWYCAATRRVRWITVAAFLIFVAFFACMATANRHSSTAVWGYPVIFGFALGMTLTTLITVAQLSTPAELISVASGLIISLRSLGGTIGLAIYNALFNHQMGKLGDNIANAVIPAGLPPSDVGAFIGALTARNETALGLIDGITPQIIEAGSDALLDTYVAAFRVVWIAAGCFVAVAAIVAAFLFDPREEFNMHIDATVETKSTSSD